MYKKPSLMNMVHLMKRFFNLYMGEGSSVVDYINELNIIVILINLVLVTPLMIEGFVASVITIRDLGWHSDCIE